MKDSKRKKKPHITITNTKKKPLVLFATLLVTVWVSAQTQQGYVKILGRPDKLGKMLANVTVQANMPCGKDDILRTK